MRTTVRGFGTSAHVPTVADQSVYRIEFCFVEKLTLDLTAGELAPRVLVLDAAGKELDLPLSMTSVALGARSRKVTVRSGWISGDLSGAGRAACAAAMAGGACCPASGAVTMTATTETAATTRARQLFMLSMGTSLPQAPYLTLARLCNVGSRGSRQIFEK